MCSDSKSEWLVNGEQSGRESECQCHACDTVAPATTSALVDGLHGDPHGILPLASVSAVSMTKHCVNQLSIS